MDIILSGLGQSYYEQIKRQLAAQILSGDLPGGMKLPSIRALAAQLSVSVITTQRAYNELEHAGYIQSVPGKGCYVAENAKDKLHKMLMEASKEKLSEAVETCRNAGLDDHDIQKLFNEILEEADHES